MKRILTIFALTVLAAACSGSSFELGETPDIKAPKYSVAPEKDSPNIIRFTFDEEGVSPFWKIRKPDGSYLESSSRDFTLRYFMKGEYDGTLTVYGRGGMDEPVPFTFSVTENDPVVKKLTGDGTQKVWVWNWYADKHFGEGARDSKEPDWWPVAAWEMKDFTMYDDELSFITDTWDYVLDTKGKIYADGTVLTLLDPDGFPEGGSYRATDIAYTQPSGQKWGLYADENGTLWLSFSACGFPSYPCCPSAMGGAYEVLELSDDVLSLKYDTGSDTYGSWFFRFVLKGTQPPTGGGEKPDKPDQPDTPSMTELEKSLTTNEDGSQKLWVWDHTTKGHYGEGDKDALEPNWWSVEPDEMKNYSMYDDELEFRFDGHAYILHSNGYVYCDKAALSAMRYEGNEATDIEYSQPEGQSWKIVEEDGVNYIVFSDMAFPSAIPVPAALGGKYRILALTADCLYLRLQTTDDSWYFRFIAKR